MFNCEVCDQTFASKSHFLVHTKEKQYQCKQCEKKFSLVGNLKRHTRIHTGEMNYSCQNCQSKFAYIDKLQRHIRRKHLLRGAI